VILSVTRSLTLATALDVVSQVDRLGTDAQVIVDLTAIPGFDTDGAAMLLGLTDTEGHERVAIVGFQQAAARLVGANAVESPVRTATATAHAPAPVTVPVTAGAGWVLRRLSNLVVVQPADGERLSTDDLDPSLTAALAEGTAIVVVDLRNTDGLTAGGLQTIAFASSSAALRGQELLIVNVTAEAADMFRGAGLSATTFVSPESALDAPTR
jgi:anti-anti-sigma regulatory factor